MYELVNTSLPNGLIPGTHGFAAVAMTKGLPDALRTRLETYCAYSHRTSAHDATYFKENPVNWFHVTLPQGDHVLGRVAPADFDYTGRTNRLARLLVFSKNEMPAIGGASVLAKEHARLSEAWSGEARWLEADKLTVGRLRLEFPSTNCDAPSWRAMFGDAEGLFLAKGFARLLAKNLSMAGRTIYFKTSTAYDIDGTKLLALFRDLIDLFPVIDRRNITFSTYPVALPQGTICHLRGVYDRDRIFDAATATQPWVDCEKGVVHNAALLPPEEVESRVRQRNFEPKIKSAPVRPTQQLLAPFEVKPQVNPTWLPRERNDGTKLLIIGIIISTLILIGALGFGIWCYFATLKQNKIQTPNTMREQGGVITVTKGEELPTNGTKNTHGTIMTVTLPSKDEVKSDDTNQYKKSGKTNDTIGIKHSHNTNRKNVIDPPKGKRPRKKETEEDHQEESSGALIHAAKVKILEHGILAEFPDTSKQRVMTNGTLRVFYYDKGILTNAPAGFISQKVGATFSPKFEPNPKTLARETSGMFLIWLDIRNNIVYWDWTPLSSQKPLDWFATTNEINLVELCFGSRAEIKDVFAKTAPQPWCFKIKAETMVNLSTTTTNEILSLDWLYNELTNGRINELNDDIHALNAKSNEITSAEKVINTHFKKYQEICNELKASSNTGSNKRKTLSGNDRTNKEEQKHKEEQAIIAEFKKLGKNFAKTPTTQSIKEEMEIIRKTINEQKKGLEEEKNQLTAKNSIVKGAKFHIISIEGAKR